MHVASHVTLLRIFVLPPCHLYPSLELLGFVFCMLYNHCVDITNLNVYVIACILLYMLLVSIKYDRWCWSEFLTIGAALYYTQAIIKFQVSHGTAYPPTFM